MSEGNDKPVTHAQLRGELALLRGEMGQMEDRLRGEMGQMGDRLRGEMGQMEDRLRGEMGQMEDRLRGEMGQMEDRLKEFMRDLQTELLRGFESFVATNEIRLRKLTADVSNIDAATDQRLTVVEKRLFEIEKRLHLNPPGS